MTPASVRLPIALLLFLSLSYSIGAQNRILVSGRVVDAATQLPLQAE